MIDIWRYRAYGLSSPMAGTNAFYDIMLPGPTIGFIGSGLKYDWYQPTHENGNILTYPAPPISGNPSDMGSYISPKGTEIRNALVPLQSLVFGGTSGSNTLTFTKEARDGKTIVTLISWLRASTLRLVSMLL